MESAKSKVLLAIGVVFFCASASFAQYQMEDLSRGVVAVRTGAAQAYVGWRLLGTEATANIGFNVYRSTDGGAAVKLNGSVITSSTNFVDNSATTSQSTRYFVRAVVNGSEQADSASFTLPANAPTQNYLRVPLQRPAGGTTPANESYTYSPGDASVGDLDGDGDYEIVLKWDPSNQKDNSQDGYTGNVFIDAYELNGTRLWRVDLGRNIRAGAHYTQFQVYDYDGDGKAEVVCKTADGTRSGTGQVIGNANADLRNSAGRILTGPEFLTVFDGQTGAIRATANFEPARGSVSDWGDSYGNRCDRFLSGTAYLDGQRPSIIMGRGYYALSKIAAWDFRNGSLTLRWLFNSANVGSSWEGRGAHSLSVADVDGNGSHEIIYGGMTINANGTGRYTTNFYAHGDALHVGDFLPSRAGLEIWMIHEGSAGPAATLRDANNGAIIFSKPNNCNCEGPGRGVAGDVYAGNAGAEFWGAGEGMTNLFNSSGGNAGRNPGSVNFLVWWDGDFVRELLDSNHIDKYGTGGDTRLLTASGASSINGTKSTPNLSADILGDWREEVIFNEANTALRIYTTTTVANNRIYTLMHDPQYRVEIARQNTAYNQPPHPSFFLGNGMGAPPTPNIVLVGGQPPPPGSITYQGESAQVGGGAFVESTNGGFNGAGYINFPANGGFLQFNNVDGGTSGATTIRIRYALGVTSSRTGQLTVNGAPQSITFSPTGSWTTWAVLVVNVNLAPGGGNTIIFQSNGQDLANIDQIQVP
ncbi:MAG TPA: carbohydrate-binding protein [Blastocatellia bacterium]